MANISDATNSRIQQATDLFIDGLKNGTNPLQRRWEPGEFQAPFNPISGAVYSGFNFAVLADAGYNDPRWMTYKQAESQGYQVKKGQKSRPGIKWSTTSSSLKRDDNGKPILDGDGNKQYTVRELANPYLRHFSVFNGTQIDGLPEIERPAVDIQNDRAEAILRNSGASIIHDQADRAFCSYSEDAIHLPTPDTFNTPEDYLATAMHELGHWAMHPDRLGKSLSMTEDDLMQPFGSEGYARNELRAEMVSMMFNVELQIGFDVGQHQAYVNSWIKALEENPDELRLASADAAKVVDYVLQLERGIDMTKDNELENLKAKAAETQQEIAANYAVTSAVLNQEHTAMRDKIDYIEQFGSSYHAPGKFKVQYADGDDWITHKKGDCDNADIAYSHAKALSVGTNQTFSVLSPDGKRVSVNVPAERITEFAPQISETQSRTYLALPYKDKDTAKDIARENDIPLRWDKQNAAWYVAEGQRVDKLSRWIPDPNNNKTTVVGDNISPSDEFAAMLRDKGFELQGDPIMDGKPHRVKVLGGNAGAADGMYVGFTDGHPAGFYENHKSGDKGNWKATGSYITTSDKTTLVALNAQQSHDRKVDQEIAYADRARLLAKQLNEMPNLNSTDSRHRYLRDKNISVGDDVKRNGNDQLVIPIYSPTGKLQSAQYIDNDGTKRLAGGAKKAGGMYVFAKDDTTQDIISGKSKSNDLFIVEGVATGHSVHEATNAPVIVAFDANNLHSVASHFKQAYPDTNIHLCADNDQGKDVNVGREAAERVSETLDLSVILPRFKDINGSDFNDLKNQEGKQAVMNQIRTGVSLYRQRKQGEVTRSAFKSGKEARGNDVPNKTKQKPREISKAKENAGVSR